MPAMETLRRHSWLGVLVAMALGLLWALPGRIPHDVLQGLLMCLLFLSCLELRPRSVLVDALGSWRSTLSVILVVSLASPLLLLPFRWAFDADTYTGLILAGTMSTGLSVIFLSELLGGSPGRALVLAVISSVLAPFSVPAVVSVFAGGQVQIEFLSMTARTSFIVFVPLAAAIAVGNTGAGRRILKVREPVSMIIFLTMIVTLVSSVRHLILESPMRSVLLLGVVVALSLLCAGLGALAGRDGRERITFAVVSSYRNSTLATVLALTLFDEAVALPPVIFVLAGNIMVVALQLTGGRLLRAGATK